MTEKQTNAIELFHADGRSAGCFYCAKCRIVHKTESEADECCRPRLCAKCGREVDARHFLVCERCRKVKQASKDLATLEAAELVEDEGGWLYVEGHGHNDGFFRDMGELLDYLADEPENTRPEFAFCCRKFGMSERSAADIIEDSTQDMHEEAANDVSVESIKALQAAIDAFYAANEDVVSYEADCRRKVRIPDGESIT